MMKMKLVVLFMVLGFVQSASAIVCYMSHPLDMYVHLSDPNCTEIEINAPGTYTLPFTVEINSSTNVTKIYGQSTFTPNDVRLKVHQTPAIIVRQDFELENLTVEGWGGPIIGTGENEQPDENPEGGCLYVSGTNQVDVLVKKVSLQHCYANNRGGAIYLGTSDRVTLDESQVILSKSQIGGGVFVGSGGRLEMTKAFFYGNEASQYGGAISVDSGSSTWPTLATSVDNSDAYYEVTFQQNKAALGGGAIAMDMGLSASSTQFICDDCGFLNNEVTDASGNGGAIYMYGLSQVSLGGGSYFFQNLAPGSGGAIYSFSSELYMSHVDFVENSVSSGEGGAIYMNSNAGVAPVISYNNLSFSRNEAPEGGAWKSLRYDIALTDSFFDANVATIGVGGALVAIGVSSSVSSAFRPSNVYFKENESDADGGAVFVQDTEFVADQVTFEQNKSRHGHGGALKAHKDLFVIANSLFVNNSTVDTAKDGGALYLSAITGANVQSTEFESNSATGQGGAVYTLATDIDFRENKFNQNYAELQGGALYLQYGANNIVDNHFELNNSNRSGGAIFIKGASSQTYSFNRNSFFSNSAYNGGAICGEATGYQNAKVDIYNSTFYDNQAASNGGALYFEYLGASVPAKFNNLSFLDNTAGGSGSAIYDSLSSYPVYNSIFYKSVTTSHLCNSGASFANTNLKLQTDPTCGASGFTTTSSPFMSPVMGAFTKYLPLHSGSVAVDSGSSLTPGSGGGSCEASDQVGASRPSGVQCDIGAVEI